MLLVWWTRLLEKLLNYETTSEVKIYKKKINDSVECQVQILCAGIGWRAAVSVPAPEREATVGSANQGGGRGNDSVFSTICEFSLFLVLIRRVWTEWTWGVLYIFGLTLDNSHLQLHFILTPLFVSVRNFEYCEHLPILCFTRPSLNSPYWLSVMLVLFVLCKVYKALGMELILKWYSINWFHYIRFILFYKSYKSRLYPMWSKKMIRLEVLFGLFWT